MKKCGQAVGQEEHAVYEYCTEMITVCYHISDIQNINANDICNMLCSSKLSTCFNFVQTGDHSSC